MEEVTEYDTVIQCDHSYNRRCAKSLKTTYEAQQVRPDCSLSSLILWSSFRQHLLLLKSFKEQHR